MKPAWDKLMTDFEGSTTSLVADVDCTESGKDLCETHGVGGFPTIKYGDPGDLKDYQGGRDYEELKKFASENLGPTCGPDYMDLCDAKSKGQDQQVYGHVHGGPRGQDQKGNRGRRSGHTDHEQGNLVRQI